MTRRFLLQSLQLHDDQDKGQHRWQAAEEKGTEPAQHAVRPRCTTTLCALALPRGAQKGPAEPAASVWCAQSALAEGTKLLYKDVEALVDAGVPLHLRGRFWIRLLDGLVTPPVSIEEYVNIAGKTLSLPVCTASLPATVPFLATLQPRRRRSRRPVAGGTRRRWPRSTVSSGRT